MGMRACLKSLLRCWTTHMVQPTHRCPSQTALPLPFLSATDARFLRCQPITGQHPAGSDVGNLSTPPTPLKVNGTGLG